MLQTLIPTAVESPDSTQGGLTVTNPTVTGHDPTTSSASGNQTTNRTCRWHTFQLPFGPVLSLSLKFDWSLSGNTGNGLKELEINYTINGGSNWVIQVQRPGTIGSGSESIPLSASQNISLVQVRDQVIIITIGAESGSITASISNIRLEADVEPPQTKPIMVM